MGLHIKHYIIFVMILLSVGIANAAYYNCTDFGTNQWGEGCYWGDANFMNDTCVDQNGDNAMDNGDECGASTGTPSACDGNVGKSCQWYDSGTPATYESICILTAGTYSCETAQVVSGELGTNLAGGTVEDFHSGNENSSCDASLEGFTCTMTVSLDPTGDGYCVDSMCQSAVQTDMNCSYAGTSACEASDAVDVAMSTGCTKDNWACESSAGANGFLQDGTCNGWACITSGHICYNVSLGGEPVYNLDSCGVSGMCGDGDPCDGALGSGGNLDTTWGTCSGASCIQSGLPTAPTVFVPAFNETSLADTEDIGATAKYIDDNGDTGTVEFRWYVNNVLINKDIKTSVANGTNATSGLSRVNYSKNDIINVTVNATDVGGLNGNQNVSTSLTVSHCSLRGFKRQSDSATLFSVDCDGKGTFLSQLTATLFCTSGICYDLSTFPTTTYVNTHIQNNISSHNASIREWVSSTFLNGTDNSTMKAYVDQQNTTLKTYVDTRRTGDNTSLLSYIQLQFTNNNTYWDTNNDTMANYVNSMDTNTWNSTNDFTGKLLNITDNGTLVTYTIQQNTTMKTYADSVDTDTNTWNSSQDIQLAVNDSHTRLTYLNVTDNGSIGGVHMGKLNATHWGIWFG